MKHEYLVMNDNSGQILGILRLDSREKMLTQDLMLKQSDAIKTLCADIINSVRESEFNASDVTLQYRKHDYSIIVDAGEEGEFALTTCDVFTLNPQKNRE